MIVAFLPKPAENYISFHFNKRSSWSHAGTGAGIGRSMEKIRKVVEIGSNVAIILVAVLLGYFLVSRYLTPPVAAPQQQAQGPVIQPGNTIPMPNVDWGKSDRNLLMVLSTSCHFCSESMPFYQKLLERNAQSKSLRVIAAMPQEVADATKYLSEHNVTVDEVIKANPGEAMVRGTPTLLLVNKDGVVMDTWIGKLPPEKENEVLERAFSEVAGL
ncbi:MAG: hypothetical protein WBO10_06440 [Pyrinomonadaceae bacterium]